MPDSRLASQDGEMDAPQAAESLGGTRRCFFPQERETRFDLD